MIWTILGFSVAIIAVFCVSVAETLVGKPAFENHREYVAGALVILGVVAWFAGRLSGKKRLAFGADGSRQFLLADLRYWGPMSVILGIITLFIQPLKQLKHDSVPKPVTAVIRAPAPPDPTPETRPKAGPVIFPELKMQGVFFRNERPFVILNGESYTVGDQLGNVVIKAIDRTGVLIELSGEEKHLRLD